MNENKFIVFDIETIPNTSPKFLERIAARERENLSPPGNIKLEESKRKWWEEKSEDVLKEKIAATLHKGGLSSVTGQVFCVSYQIVDNNFDPIDKPKTLSLLDIKPENIELAEKTMLQAFSVAVSYLQSGFLGFIGHNVLGFDIPFLYDRMIIHGVKAPDALKRVSKLKPWELKGRVFDTMLEWAGNNPQKRVSLDDLCFAFDIPSPKDGIDGSKVFQAFQDGRYDKISEYCEKDVEATRLLAKRLLIK